MWVCWLTVLFCGAYSTVMIPLTSKKTIIMVLILYFNTQACFGLGNAGVPSHGLMLCFWALLKKPSIINR
jgi:hypothetical protein